MALLHQKHSPSDLFCSKLSGQHCPARCCDRLCLSVLDGFPRPPPLQLSPKIMWPHSHREMLLLIYLFLALLLLIPRHSLQLRFLVTQLKATCVPYSVVSFYSSPFVAANSFIHSLPDCCYVSALPQILHKRAIVTDPAISLRSNIL